MVGAVPPVTLLHVYTWIVSGFRWQLKKKGPADISGSVSGTRLIQTLVSMSEWGPDIRVADSEAEIQDSLDTTVKGQ